ncbi:hypothetical protein [Heterosigma akashiwo virus 01]|jgi:hypothetical protein|uniref:Uncharacterized protein n=1 Tax=Heterosigma akashiwo virus 01 TaxID=97195 RepID=A0A1C9C5K5_HAV01|nr:hypothetical protein D1R72_gp237 [Heterosigma akashiwo virus 01]AOM63568.1 hypothetical protein [Heterosigma akashiwo virus 01]
MNITNNTDTDQEEYYSLICDNNNDVHKFMGLTSFGYKQVELQFFNILGNSNAGSNIVVIGDDKNSLITSAILSFGANFDVILHHYIIGQGNNIFKDTHKQLRNNPLLEKNIALYSSSRNSVNNYIQEMYEDNELDVIYVDITVDENFIREFLTKLWPKMKSHSNIVFRTVEKNSVNLSCIYKFFGELKCGVPIPICHVDGSCGYLSIKKPSLKNN